MKRWLLFLGLLIVLSMSVSAVECVVPTDGMVITEDTVFCSGEYYLPNGIELQGEGISLDCNGSILTGLYYENFGNVGIDQIWRHDSVFACTVKNYTWGMRIIGGEGNIVQGNNLIDNGQWGLMIINSDNNYVIGNNISDNNLLSTNDGILLDGDYNLIQSNIISGHDTQGVHSSALNGIRLDGNYNMIIYNEIFNNGKSISISANYNNITENYFWYSLNISPNIFKNNLMLVYGSNNNIWKNNFNTSGIYASGSGSNNSYCVSCVGNNYYSGATGPMCPSSCEDEDNDGVPDIEDKCLGTELPEIFDRLIVRRYGDIDGDLIFETRERIGGPIIDSEFEINDTYGCSCKQILELKPGRNEGERRFGCTRPTINNFINRIAWARNLF